MNDLLRVGAHYAAAILVQVTVADMTEEDDSDGRITNGATTRVSLALRNAVLSQTHGGVKEGLRIVLQMSRPSDYIKAVNFTHAHTHQPVVLPMDILRFLNAFL